MTSLAGAEKSKGIQSTDINILKLMVIIYLLFHTRFSVFFSPSRLRQISITCTLCAGLLLLDILVHWCNSIRSVLYIKHKAVEDVLWVHVEFSKVP